MTDTPRAGLPSLKVNLCFSVNDPAEGLKVFLEVDQGEQGEELSAILQITYYNKLNQLNLKISLTQLG